MSVRKWAVRHPGIGVLHYDSEQEARVAAGTAAEMLGEITLAPVAEDRLYGKFRVERVDGRDKSDGNKVGDKADARYFVLDYVHDPYSRIALAAYADACEQDLPGLATDLRAALDWVSRYRRGRDYR